MVVWGVRLHDAEVVAVEHRRESRGLVLRLRLTDGASASLEFTGVEGWELSPFREQNVLLDVYSWPASDERTRERIEELGLPRAWLEAVMSGACNLYEVDASVGIGGYVVARSAEAKIQ